MSDKIGESSNSSIALIGNPNVGKSVIFGYLTGRYVTVSNYPGTTVEVSRGKAKLGDAEVEIIDTPGINNLLPSSEDEVVTRDILFHQSPEKLIQIIDSKNLSRGLLLSLQLIEIGIPFIIVLNMNDEALQRGIRIDSQRLSQILDVPVIKTVATRHKGLERIKAELNNARPGTFRITYPNSIENALTRLSEIISNGSVNNRALFSMIIAGDVTLSQYLMSKVSEKELIQIEDVLAATKKAYSDSLHNVITTQRLKVAREIEETVTYRKKPQESGLFSFIGKISVHPVWGYLGVILVLIGMYEFVGVFGAGTLVDILQTKFFDGFITPNLQAFFKAYIPSTFIYDLLVGEYGLFSMALSYSVAIVLPIVGTFFIAFSILEDSGYLPRLAMMVNRAFRLIGLNGKAVLPMVLGLGCDTMATLTTRILDTKKERIIVTLLLALGIPCSAQLGVILGMLGGLSVLAVITWFVLIALVLLTVGYLSSRLLKGEESDFIMEIPPIRVPSVTNILVKTIARIEWYLKEAVPLFFLGTLILFIFDKTGMLILIQKLMSPVIESWLNLPREASNAFLVGFLRRDYGAAGLYHLTLNGQMDSVQILVSLIAITLFMPCIANFFIIIKERGWKTAFAMAAFILPFSLLVAGIFNLVVRKLGVF